MFKKLFMGTFNNFFFPFPKRKKEVISLVFALKGGFKNIVFQTALISILTLSSIQFLFPTRVFSQETVNNQIIFSRTQIKKGESPDALGQTKLLIAEKIFARAYFSEKFGTLGVEEYGILDLWIDGVFIKRFIFSNYDVPPSGKEMRLYVHNTGKDDFDSSYYSALGKGDHTIRIVIGRDQIIQSDQNNDRPSLKENKYTHLAEGSFILVVQ